MGAIDFSGAGPCLFWRTMYVYLSTLMSMNASRHTNIHTSLLLLSLLCVSEQEKNHLLS